MRVARARFRSGGIIARSTRRRRTGLGTPGYFHEHHLGPAQLGTSLEFHQLGIRLDVGKQYVEMAAGPAWAQFPGSCFELGVATTAQNFTQ